MRYLIGFVLFALALGTARLVGCGEETGPKRCETDEECDDQNECTREYCRTYSGECQYQYSYIPRCDYNGVEEVIEDGYCVRPGLCEKNPCDDDNECTWDDLYLEECEHGGNTGGQPCDWNGNPGVCIDGVCTEYPCNGGVICDDGDPCTDEWCDYRDGTCIFPPKCPSGQCRVGSCNPANGSCHYTPVPDGTRCDIDCWIGVDRCSRGECVCSIGGSAGAFEGQP